LKFLACLFLIISISGYSQVYTFVLRDSTSKQAINGVRIYTKSKALIVLDSIVQVDWSKQVSGDTIYLKISKKGYQIRETILTKTNNSPSLLLSPLVKELEEVSVAQKKTLESTESGNLTLNKKQLDNIPYLLGEKDPIKAIQLLPGIQSSGDGNGIYVRGGGIDQNLVLLDDIPIYNASHLFGFFSVFNGSAIQSVDIHKGNMPAEYGGRISSVIGIKTQTGNMRKWKGEGGIGILAANFTIQGPIKKDTSSLLISFRRTYVDAFKQLFSSQSKYNTNYFFYDLNFKYAHRLTSKTLLTVNAFMGYDYFLYSDNTESTFSNQINWGTKLGSVQLHHFISPKSSVKFQLGVTDYQMGFGASIYNYRINLFSSTRDYIAKGIYSYKVNTKYSIKCGFENSYRILSPNNFNADAANSAISYSTVLKLNSNELNFFVSNEIILSSSWKTTFGFRQSFFQQLGPFTNYNFNESEVKTDSIYYPRGKVINSYFNPEPRISVQHSINEISSLKFGFSQNYQYIHLAPVSSISLPTDVWIPSSTNIKPQFGSQFSVGYYRSLVSNAISFSVESYYKSMNNLIEYKEGVLSLVKVQSNFDDNFYFGKGESYGIEFFVKKSEGKFTGWLGYTLSKTTRKFADIEQGRTFYAKNDRRHDISLVANYQWNKKWSISSVFVFKSGNAITIPIARYFLQGNIINTYSLKNDYRVPAYHRCDVSLNYIHYTSEKFTSTWVLSVYNIYGRQNPFYIYFETTGDISKFSIQTKANQVSLFTILPSLSWKFEF
jgi:hypothetical protein